MAGADIWDSTWHRFDGKNFGNGTLYMQRGWGPNEMFWGYDGGAANATAIGLKNWIGLHGEDRSKWPFNTNCCAYSRQDCGCGRSAA